MSESEDSVDVEGVFADHGWRFGAPKIRASLRHTSPGHAIGLPAASSSADIFKHILSSELTQTIIQHTNEQLSKHSADNFRRLIEPEFWNFVAITVEMAIHPLRAYKYTGRQKAGAKKAGFPIECLMNAFVG